jgi:clan AA aspartic protease (TIGR02281 family)
MGAKKEGAGVLAEMHSALFAAACILSAMCGAGIAYVFDAALLDAFGTAGNFATPIFFLILLLVGLVSPPTVLLGMRWQARRDHARLQVSEPVLAERPATTTPQEQKEEPLPREQQDVRGEQQLEAQGHEESQESQAQKVAQERQDALSTADHKAAQPDARPSATLGPILVNPVFVPRHHRKRSGILLGTIAVLAAFAVGLLVGGKELSPSSEDIRAYAIEQLRALVQAVDIDRPADQSKAAEPADQSKATESEFASLYKRLGIAPLPVKLEHDAEVNRGLTRLRQEACDKDAIFSLGQALQKSGYARVAANAYLGYAATCGNGEGDKYAAANILYQLADYDQVIMIMTDLIAANPSYAHYRYLRGAAFKDAKRYDEALTDYANTIELFDTRRNIGEWVFLEMSAAYAALKQYCAAITPIQTWVAIDPTSRETSKTRKLMLDYSKQGNCELHYATGSDSFPHDSGNVIRAKVNVNGVDGNFLVDTGASFVVVTSDFAMRSKVEVLRQSVTMQTANGRADSTLGHAATVRVGRRVEAADVPILIQNRSLGRDVDGLLGMSFLSRFDLSIGRRDWTLSPKK